MGVNFHAKRFLQWCLYFPPLNDVRFTCSWRIISSCNLTYFKTHLISLLIFTSDCNVCTVVLFPDVARAGQRTGFVVRRKAMRSKRMMTLVTRSLGFLFFQRFTVPLTQWKIEWPAAHVFLVNWLLNPSMWLLSWMMDPALIAVTLMGSTQMYGLCCTHCTLLG